ncbi:hypothetical protein, partial [Leptospira bouyouniensis]|uniref:hypothetical protein n=1 Tax=Leptospira bouyouniensis TaxID=2484911 RepID=UPI001AEFD730
ILGSLMNEKNKNEVLNTIFHMRNNLSLKEKKILPIFKFYTSQILPNSFKLATKLTNILDSSNQLHPPESENAIDLKFKKII